ncbi:MAG: AAA family ATPase [Campylobacterales bacterium]|nr:AAA family ATPase [Campylobacterales bacterium]
MNNQISRYEYTPERIKNAPEIEYLYPDFIVRGSISVIYGSYGSGKSSIAIYLSKNILESNENIHVYYLDFDNPIQVLKSRKIDEEITKYSGRLKFFGPKNRNNAMNEVEQIFDLAIFNHKKNPDIKILMIIDSLKNVARKNENGLIDSRFLYENEKRAQDFGISIVILHHTNKAGAISDTKDISNFADCTFHVKYDANHHIITVEPDKQSRYGVLPRAFYVNPDSRMIEREIEYSASSKTESERKLIDHMIGLISSCGGLNLSELEHETRTMRASLHIGEKQFRSIMHKNIGICWAAQRALKNALVFYTLKKQPNCETAEEDDVDQCTKQQ